MEKTSDSLCIIIICILLSACSSENHRYIEAIIIHDNVEQTYVESTDSVAFDIVDSYITAGVKEDGFVDYIKPPFTLELIYSSGKSEEIYLHIYDEGENSHYLFSDDTSTGYTVNVESTKRLLELINRYNGEDS